MCCAGSDADSPADEAMDVDIDVGVGPEPGVSDVWLTAAELDLFAGEFNVTDADVAAALRKLLGRRMPIEDVTAAPADSPLRHARRGEPVSWSTNDAIGRQMQAALRERLERINESCFKTPAAIEFLEITSHMASRDRTNLLHWVHKHGDDSLRSCLPKCECHVSKHVHVNLLL